MRKIILLLLSLVSFSLFAQNAEEINKTDAKGNKQGVWKKVEDGKKVYVK